MQDDSSDNLCIVCCKSVQYYSIGECDHPVCFECSTRMRVLYEQKECPICRQIMPLVIFTEKVKPFKEINHNDFHFDDSAKISFENADIMKAYYDLQTIKCPKCRSSNQTAFMDFKALQAHVKEEHNHTYCDLCVKHLKIFPFERRAYSKSELITHNKQGDRNDRSHKGHALCQFCNERFFDVDLLYRHLRKDHLFCHFCDADGQNKFYSEYRYLRDHFQKRHYLCEEGDCRNEQFTNAFRTDIDLKAHKVNTHGKNLGKQAYREARIVDLQLNYKPRSDNRNRSAPHSSRGNESTSSQATTSDRARERERELVVVDYSEFPSLAGSSSSTAAPVFRKFPDRISGRNNFKMSKENFPALGGAGNFPALGGSKENFPSLSGDGNTRPTSSNTKSAPVNTKPTTTTSKSMPVNPQEQKAEATTSASSGTVRNLKSSEVAQSSNENVLTQWGSSKKNEQPQQVEKPKPVKKTRTEEFPSLGTVSSNSGKQKKLNKPIENDTVSISQSNKIKVKNKSEAENNVDKSKSEKNKKKNNESKHNDGTSKSTKKELSSENNKNSVNSSSSKNSVNDKKTNDSKAMNNLAKAMSNLTNLSGKDKNAVNNKMNLKNSSNGMAVNNTSGNSALVNNKTSGNSQAVNNNFTSRGEVSNSTSSSNSMAVNNNVGKKNKNAILNDKNFPALSSSHLEHNQTNGNQSKKKQKSSSTLSEPKSKSVPPGFEPQMRQASTNPPSKSAVKPPPGFTSLSSPAFNQSFSYTFPPNFEDRNAALERTCRNIFEKNKKSFRDFVQESELFVGGIINADTYLKTIGALLGMDQLHTVFPELIALLPIIQKQQELLSAYEKVASKSAKRLRNEECALCGQVLNSADRPTHASAHVLNMNFPPLGLTSVSRK